MKLCNIAILISGGGTNAQSIIDAVNSGKIANSCVCAVISDSAQAYGLTRAKKAGIQAITVDKKLFADKKQFQKELLLQLKQSKADLVVLAGFLSIVSQEIVQEFAGKMINIHPSLIPKYCGMGYYGEKVHQAVIANKEKVSGATVHLVEVGVDTGKILLQKEVKVMPDDTPETLASKVLVVEHEILVQAVKTLSEMFLTNEINENRVEEQ